MAVLFAGHELDSFTSYTPGMFGVWTAASNGFFDADFSRSSTGAVRAVNRLDNARIDIPSTSEGWVQFRWRMGIFMSSGPSLVAYSPDDSSALFDLYLTSSTGAIRGATSDTARTSITPAAGIAADEVALITIHWKAVSGGMLLELFKNGVLVSTATISNAYLSGKTVGIIRMGGNAYSTAQSYFSGFSELVVADEDPRGWRVATLSPNASGTTSEWVGGYADVNQAGIDDANFISTELANKVQLMGLSNLSVSAQNMDVKAVTVSSRGRKGSMGPQNIQVALRTNGSTVFSPNLAGVEAEFNNLSQQIWANNPVTGVKFTVPEIQGLEAGFKSIA